MIDLNGPGNYLTLGWFQVSWANAIVIATMLALFVAALMIPFPGQHPVQHLEQVKGRDGDTTEVTS